MGFYAFISLIHSVKKITRTIPKEFFPIFDITGNIKKRFLQNPLPD